MTAPAPPTTEQPTEPPETEPTTPETGETDPAAKPEIDWKARSREWEKRAKANADAAKRLAEIEDAQKTETERMAAKVTAAEEQVAGLRDRAVRAEVRALAADKFADPEDAAAFLDLTKYVDDGDIDTDAIQTDLADLLTRKPHLAKQTGPRLPQPDPSQGARPDGPAGLDDQIRQAEEKGDVRLALHLQNQKLLKAAGKK